MNRPRGKILTAALVALMLAGILSACGSSDDDSSSASETSATEATGDTTESSGAGGSKTVGVVAIEAADPLNQAVIEGIENAADAAGWGPVKVTNTQGNADLANSSMRTYATQGVGMIIDMAWPVEAIAGGLQAAKENSIPIGGWGSGVAPGILFSTSDAQGPLMADYTAEAMKDGGDVLGLFYQGGQLCRERQTDLEDTLGSNPDINLEVQQLTIPGELELASKFTTAWLAQHPKGSGNLAIWACWDTPMYGALSVLKAQGRDDVVTVSGNGGEQAIREVSDGFLSAEAWGDGVMEGEIAFEETLAAIEAGASGEGKEMPVPEANILVTADNVEEFLEEHPGAAGE